MSFVSRLYSRLQVIFGVDLLHTLIVTASLFITSFFSYLLQFYLGRTLSVEGFGDFTALLSLAGILTFFGNIVGYAVVKIYSELTTQKETSKIKWLFLTSLKYSALFGLLLGIATFIFAKPLAQALNIDTPQTVGFFGLYLMFAFVPIYLAVFFQGISRFIWFSVYIIVSGVLRLIIPIMFLNFFSADPAYVYLGFFVTQVISIGLGLLIAHKAVLQKVTPKADPLLVSHIWGNSLFNGLALFTLTTMLSIDMLAVKYFFEPYSAGIYAGVITLGKIVIFGAGSVATVMFPRAVAVNKDYIGFKKTVTKFGIIQLLFVFVGLLIFSIFPSFITHTLFGDKFDASIPFVAMYTLNVSIYVLINFLILVLVALGEKRFSLFFPIFLIIQIFGFVFLHTSLSQIIVVNITSMSLLLIFMLFTINKVFSQLKGKAQNLNVS